MTLKYFSEHPVRLLFPFLIVPVVFISIMLIYAVPISPDGVQYTDLGRSLFNKGVYDSPFGVAPGWLQPPVIGYLIGIFCFIFPFKIAGYIVGIISSILILYLLFKFVRTELNYEIAVFCLVLLAINPLFMAVSLKVVAEPVYTIIHFALFSIFFIIYKKKIKPGLLQTVLISILFITLYFTRPEAILYFPIILFMLFKYADYKKALVYVLITTLCLSAYGIYTKSHTGKFNPFPKISYNTRLGKVLSQYYNKHEDQISNMDNMSLVAWYAYDSDVKNLYSNKVMNEEYYKNFKKEIEKSNDKTIANSLFKRILYNLGETVRTLVKSAPFPIMFLIFILTGFYFALKNNRSLLIAIAIWVFPAFYFMVSHVEERFFYVMLPYAATIAALGIWNLSKILIRYKFVPLVFFILIIINFFPFYKYAYYSHPEVRAFYELSPELKEKHIRKICSKNFHLAFFGDADYLKLPACTPQELYEYMNINNTKYVIIGDEIKESHYQLDPLFLGQDPDFKLIQTYELYNVEYKLFKIK